MIKLMPSKRRKVFILSRLEGKSYAEIAELLGISRKTVENHINLALKELRKITKCIAIFF
jgi:RNA polymerase sigma-70 factor (ECF subfamily)